MENATPVGPPTAPHLDANVVELATAGAAIYGPRWKARMADFLTVDRRTIARWLKGHPRVPEAVVRTLRRAVNGAGTRDEWIVGAGHRGAREYLVHTRAPRFIARLVALDGAAPQAVDAGADIDSGVVRRCKGGAEMLCEFGWLDPPPRDRELRALLDRAEGALDDYQQQLAA